MKFFHVVPHKCDTSRQEGNCHARHKLMLLPEKPLTWWKRFEVLKLSGSSPLFVCFIFCLFVFFGSSLFTVYRMCKKNCKFFIHLCPVLLNALCVCLTLSNSSGSMMTRNNPVPLLSCSKLYGNHSVRDMEFGKSNR